jgi:hypothetical protein
MGAQRYEKGVIVTSILFVDVELTGWKMKSPDFSGL